MEEAKVSFNVKFRMQGFECQLTLRGDEEGSGPAITRAQAAVRMLAGIVGVTPTNGNGHAAAAPVPPASPRATAVQVERNIFTPAAQVCPVCGQSDELELVSFERDGKPRQAWKCHRCEKWLPDKKK